jgi:hypothetical protein
MCSSLVFAYMGGGRFLWCSMLNWENMIVLKHAGWLFKSLSSRSLAWESAGHVLTADTAAQTATPAFVPHRSPVPTPTAAYGAPTQFGGSGPATPPQPAQPPPPPAPTGPPANVNMDNVDTSKVRAGTASRQHLSLYSAGAVSSTCCPFSGSLTDHEF